LVSHAEKTIDKKASTASEKVEKFEKVPNSFSEHKSSNAEQEHKSTSNKKTKDIKLVEKIDIDKERDENLESIRKLNSKTDEQLPKNNRKGFCTNCVIF